MLLNAPNLEASEDIRQAKLIGSILGGDKGREYLDWLVDMAWEDDPETAREVKTHIAAADASRGLPRNRKEPTVVYEEPQSG